jgi:hypothetical protein
LKDDIDQLNAFVKVTQDQLNARGETTHDLLANLFKGYLSCKDPTFSRYIEKKQEDYDDGATFTVDSLMNLASNKFKTLKESGKWLALTDEQSKIIALESKIGKMVAHKANPNCKSTQSGPNPKKSNRNNHTQRNQKSPQKQKSKPTILPWMTKYPGKDFVDANKSITKDGKQHWWCMKHKRFVRHQTNECRLNNSPPGNNIPSYSSLADSKPDTVPSVRISTATLMNE